ncbi:MAG: polyketide synthase dehydratase domain-containing protein [Planctomycetales bacterium]|nr:polyketide synthase dehydratase domain-containing protein [Planctomycetales bacterium]
MSQNRLALEPRQAVGEHIVGDTNSTGRDCELLLFAADEQHALADQLRHFADRLPMDGDIDLQSQAYVLNTGLGPGKRRIAIVASHLEDLRNKLQKAVSRLNSPGCEQIRDVTGIYYSANPLGIGGKVAFLFPGEGAQYLGMLAGLPQLFPSLAATLQMVDDVVSRSDEPAFSLTRFFDSADRYDDQDRDLLDQELRRLDNAMFSVLIADYMMHTLASELSIRCDAMAGHSAGELAALIAAGCVGTHDNMPIEENLFRVSHGFQQIGRLADQRENQGVLLALGARRQIAEEVLANAALRCGLDDQAFVAMDNCPHQSVIVGLTDFMIEVENEIKQRGLVYERLTLDRPYHTKLFAPFMGPLRELFRRTPFTTPKVPIYSCTTANLFPKDSHSIRELTVSHWESPVEYTKMVNRMYDDGVRVFLEVGPKNNLCSFTEDILRGRASLVVPMNVARGTAWRQLQHAVAQLAVHHVNLDVSPFYQERLADRPSHDGTLSHDDVQEGRSTDNHTVPRTNPLAVSVMDNYWANMQHFLQVQGQVMHSYSGQQSSGQQSSGQQSSGQRPARGGRRRRGREPSHNRQRPDELAPSLSITQAGAGDQEAALPVPTRPLLGDVVELEAGERIVVLRKFDLGEDLYALQHTVGGRSVSKVVPDQHGLPVVPMTFTLEMIAEVCERLLPSRKIIGFKNVRLLRWLALAEDPTTVQVTAKRAPVTDALSNLVTDEFLVEVRQIEGSTAGTANKWTAAVATVMMGPQLPPAPESEMRLHDERASSISLEVLYNNLFHGEAFQGVRSLDAVSGEGMHASIEVLPRHQLFASQPDCRFVLDPVLMDVAMHPMAAWHLEFPDQEGRILLPVGIDRVEFYDGMLPVGTTLSSISRSTKETTRQFTHDFDVVRPDGRLWCRFSGCHYYRFYLPFHEFNFHGPKDVYFLSQEAEWTLPDDWRAGPEQGRQSPKASCMLLDVPTDLQNPSMQVAAVAVMLSEREQKSYRELQLPVDRQTEWLFRRAVGKDAVRQHWRARSGERMFMADVELEDHHGGYFTGIRRGERPALFPHVSVASTGSVVVGVASESPTVGVAIWQMGERATAETGSDTGGLSLDERKLAMAFGDSLPIAEARLESAKRATASAFRDRGWRTEMFSVRHVDPASGDVEVVIAEETSRAARGWRVHTVARNKMVVAVTLAEPWS